MKCFRYPTDRSEVQVRCIQVACGLVISAGGNENSRTVEKDEERMEKDSTGKDCRTGHWVPVPGTGTCTRVECTVYSRSSRKNFGYGHLPGTWYWHRYGTGFYRVQYLVPVLGTLLSKCTANGTVYGRIWQTVWVQ